MHTGTLDGFITTYICFTVIGVRLAERDQRTTVYQPTRYNHTLGFYTNVTLSLKSVEYRAQIWIVQTNLILPSLLAQVT